MRLPPICLLALALLLSAASAPRAADAAPPAAYAVRVLDAAAAQADVALMRRALQTAHPGLTRYTPQVQIDAAFAALEARVGEPIDELALYREISLLLAQIRCDHTKAEWPHAMRRWREDAPSHLPWRFEVFDGRMIVATSDPAQRAIARGSEIVSINGLPAAQMLKTVAAAVSIDGFTEASRSVKLADDSDLMGSDFDNHLPAFYPAFFGLPGDLLVRVQPWPGGAVQEHRLRPLSFKQWRDLPLDPGTARVRAEFHKTLRLDRIDANTMRLTIPTFVNYRNPVAPASVYDPIFRRLRDEGVQHLVIDLRGNGGGSGDATIALAAYLLDQPFLWNLPIRMKAVRFGDLERYIETWGNTDEIFRRPLEHVRALVPSEGGGFEFLPQVVGWPEMLPTTPSPLRFGGRVTLLTDARNGSGTTMLVAKLVDEKRVHVVGQATGGSAEGPTAGRIFMLKLPASGITVRVPNMFNRMAVKNFRPGLGVLPDVVVAPSVEDFVSRRDRVLEVALAATKNHPRPGEAAKP